jgi:signal transduction histidine kinase
VLLDHPVTRIKAVVGLPAGELARLSDTLVLSDAIPMAYLPLQAQSELIGDLVLWGPGLKEDQLQAYLVFAGQVASVIRSAQLLRAERIVRQQSETLRQVASVLSTSLHLEQILAVILDQLARVIEFDSGSVMFVHDGIIDLAAWRGAEPYILPLLPLPVDYLTGVKRVVEERKPVLVADTHQEKNWTRRPNIDRLRSWLGVPLITQDGVIGLLNLNKTEPDFYHERDGELALAFANQATIAITNAQLFDQIQTQAGELESQVAERTRDLGTLYDVTAITSEHRDLSAILGQALDRSLEGLGCEMGAIHIPKQPENKLAPVVQAFAAAAGSTSLPEEINELVGRVFEEGHALVVQGKGEEPYPPFVSFVGVPMRFRGQVLGVLSVFGEETEKFSVEQLALLSTIADHVAVAVENARLSEEAREAAVLQERARLARELHDAATQQLYSLTLFAEAAREAVSANRPAKALDFLGEIDVSAHQVLKEMRLLLYELRGSTLRQGELARSLSQRLDTVEGRAGVTSHLVVELSDPLRPAVEEALFRIAQEALNNALKHALATSVTVRVFKEADQVVMTVADDGQGFDPGRLDTTGMGLANMRERAERVGASVAVASSPGHGTVVRVAVPAEAAPLLAGSPHSYLE